MYGGVDLFGENVGWTTLMDVWERGVNERLDVSNTDPIDSPHFRRGGTGLKSKRRRLLSFCANVIKQR